MTDETRDESTTPTEPTPAAEPTTAATEPVAPAAPAPKRLVRRPEGKIIGGVCTGLGAYTGVDPVAWRIAFVVLTLVSGVGLIGYIVAWLVMPMAREGEPLPPVPSDNVRIGRWVGIGAIILGALVLFRGIWHVRGGLFWGLLLLGVGIALWGRELAPESLWPRSNPTPRPPDDTPAGVAVTAQQSSVASPPPPLRPPTASAAVPAPTSRRRESSVLGRLVVGAAALAVGIAFLLDNTGVINLTARGMFAVLLAIVGAGLLIGSFYGRARWLVFPGLVVAVILSGFAFLPSSGGSFGDILWQPTAQRELRTNYRHGAGDVTLDLTHVDFGRKDRSINVRMNFGNLEIVVPEDVPVTVSSRVQGGNLDLFGRETNGWGVRNTVSVPGEEGIGRLTLNTRLAFGNTEIRRGRPGEVIESTGRRGTRVIIGPGVVRVHRGDSR